LIPKQRCVPPPHYYHRDGDRHPFKRLYPNLPSLPPSYSTIHQDGEPLRPHLISPTPASGSGSFFNRVEQRWEGGANVDMSGFDDEESFQVGLR